MAADPLTGRANLAHETGMAGDPAGARDQYAALLPILERVLGPEHPDALTARRDVANWTGEAGDLAAARDHLEQAEEAAQAIGAAGPHVPVNLGWVLRREHDLDGARDQFQTALRVSRRTGERSSLAEASLGLACVAADLGDCDRAATLHGTAQAFAERAGQPWQELEVSYRRDSLHKVRTSLGEEQFERAYAKGMMLSPDQAIDLALGKSLPAT